MQTTSNASAPAVLIVDDDPWFRSFARQILKSDHSIVEADSVEAGEKVLHAMSVNLMIADIMMPGMPGFSIIASARREFPALKILAVSAIGSDDGYFRMARLSGADAALAKPFTHERLKESVRFLLSGTKTDLREIEKAPGDEPSTTPKPAVSLPCPSSLGYPNTLQFPRG